MRSRVPTSTRPTPHVKRTNATAQPPNDRPRSGISWSSTRSVGARMNTSHMMSGCCWLPLMKPITRRPVATLDHRLEALAHHLLKLHPLLDHRPTSAALQQRLLHAREAPAQQTRHQVVLVIGLRARRPAAVELLQQRHHPDRDRRQHVATARGCALDGSRAHSRAECARDSEDHPIENRQRTRSGEENIARWVLALRLAREPCAMDKGDDLEPPGARHSRLARDEPGQQASDRRRA